MSSSKDEHYAQIIGEIEQLMLECDVLDKRGQLELRGLSLAKQLIERIPIADDSVCIELETEG